MTNHFGSTKMPTQRDKRKQSRKLYRQIRRGWRDAASQERVQVAPLCPAADSDGSRAPPPCALSNEHAEDDAESDSKRNPTARHPAGNGGAASKKIMNKASRLERAAQRRIARLQRCSQSSLSPLDNCILLEIATYMPALDLHTLLRVNRRWRWTLQAHDSFLWKPHCTAVWSGRYISRPELFPFVQSAAATLQPEPDARSAASPTTEAPAEFGSWEEKPPQSWREALCRSITHGRSTTLSSSEVAAGSWQISFKLDPTIPPQRIQFYITPMPHVRTPGFPQMPWALYQGGTVLHVHVFPEQAVNRDATTWMWSMHNRFVGIDAIPTVLAQRPIIAPNLSEYLPPPFVPSPPAAAQPTSDSEISDVAESEELHATAGADQPYSTDRSDTDPDPRLAPECGIASALGEGSQSLKAEQRRFLSKPREAVGRGRPLPVVSGHGGDCDGEDPPPSGCGAAAAMPCAHSDVSSDTTEAGECGAGRHCSTQDSGTTVKLQQVGSRLSMATCTLFDAIMREEYAQCARSKELCAFQALGTVRLLDHAPRRMRLNFPAHLLDQGHPRKPP